MSDYEGKVVVITGASSGIGAQLARELDSRGAKLVLAARSTKPLQQVAVESTDAIAVTTDVTKRADHERLLAKALVQYGHVDIWVNNAGRGITRPFADLTDEDIDTMVADNFKSVVYGMQTVLPSFKARGTGVIANVSSMLSRTPFAPVRAAYSASKAAVNSITETLRIELAEDYPGIRLVTVLPGVVATDFGNNAVYGGFDSRKSPAAQGVDEVARVIADGLLAGPVDLYTRPESYDSVSGYYKSLATPN
jgi:NADP-dependent 3-hydroxy acid dehydrogenase YdfG